jgi:serine/threonine protein kinase
VAADVFGIVGSLQSGLFRVTSVVADGPSSVLYRAHHEGFQADVALECWKLPASLTPEQTQGFLLRFREAKKLLFELSLALSAVVRPLHIGTLESAASGAIVPFVALEWLEGETIEALVGRRAREGKPPLDLAHAARLLGPAARAVERAHRLPGANGSRGVLHGALEPRKLFVAKALGEEVIKILGYGAGQVTSGGVPSSAYAAPEQWLPRRYGPIGTWTDVWGFALSLLEVLSGRAPFEGDPEAAMKARLDERVRPTPRALGVELPSAVEAAFEKALAVDPRDRYADLGEFWDVIEGAAQRLAALRAARSPGDIPDLDLASVHPKGAGARAPSPVEPAFDFQIVRNEPSVGLEHAAAPSSTSSRLELDDDSILPSRPIGRVAADLRMPPPRPRAAELFSRSLPALELLGLAGLVMAADMAYASHAGAPLTLGPLRAVHVAGPLGVWGLFKLASGLFGG